VTPNYKSRCYRMHPTPKTALSLVDGKVPLPSHSTHTPWTRPRGSRKFPKGKQSITRYDTSSPAISRKVTCPKCGKKGVLKTQVKPSGTYQYVRHTSECWLGRADGKVLSPGPQGGYTLRVTRGKTQGKTSSEDPVKELRRKVLESLERLEQTEWEEP